MFVLVSIVLVCGTSSTVKADKPTAEQIEKMKAAVPGKATVKPVQPRRLLVFTLCKGFRHSSIECGAKALEIMGQKTGAYETVVSEDVSMFAPEKLRQFDAVCFLNTTGELFDDPALKKSLLEFVRGGKGIVGIHAATDCFYKWPEFGEMMGGYFHGHPWGANDTVTLKIEEPDHPLCAPFEGKTFVVTDEIYQFREPYSREKLRVLLSLDTSKTDMKKGGIHRTDGDFAVSWVRAYGKGRVFYCSLGHREDVYWNPTVLRYYLAGIQYALGELKADATPSTRAQLIPAQPKHYVTDLADVIDAELETRLNELLQELEKKTSAQMAVLTLGTTAGESIESFSLRTANKWALGQKDKDNGVLITVAIHDRKWRIEVGVGLENVLPDSFCAKTAQDEFTSRFRAGDFGEGLYQGALRLAKRIGEDVGVVLLEPNSSASASEGNWVLLFNGQDLTGWKGLVGNPVTRAKMSPAELAEAQAAADQKMHAHWKVEDGALVFDGSHQGSHLCTIEDYGDFELLVDWKIGAGGDSGIYLRGSPQVQIWDPGQHPEGSGGLYNNKKHVSKPLKCADKPVGEWNTFRIKMVGERVTVYLNDALVTDDVVMENYWERGKPIYTAGQIELQSHGSKLYFKNIRIREIPRGHLRDAGVAGWIPLFNGKDLTGWTCKPGAWAAEDGVLTRKGGSDIWTEGRFGDFVLDLEFKITKGTNSGVFFRTADIRDCVQTGIEMQVLDSYGKETVGKHDCGAIYDCLAPSKNTARPPGEWNHVVLTCKGPKINIVLNGAQIIDMDLDQWTEPHENPDGSQNKYRTAYKNMPRVGYIGFQDHGKPVRYRNVRIKRLD